MAPCAPRETTRPNSSGATGGRRSLLPLTGGRGRFLVEVVRARVNRLGIRGKRSTDAEESGLRGGQRDKDKDKDGDGDEDEEEDEEAGEREGKGEATASSVIAYFKIPII